MSLPVIGSWSPTQSAPAFTDEALQRSIESFREPAYLLRQAAHGGVGVGLQGVPSFDTNGSYPLLAVLPALYPEWLGERSFLEAHQVRFPYIAGEMANGIATAQMVIEMARAQMLGFFGAAGLPIERVAQGLATIKAALGDAVNWGSNLIHSPNEPHFEQAIAELYLQQEVRRVSASAYMGLTPSIVQYALSGVFEDSSGFIHRKNYVFAKVSRPEVARRFLAPAPKVIVDALVTEGKLTPAEARLAAYLPLAEDFTVEADSGGHTDNQTLTAIFPIILRLRDELSALHKYQRPIRVGAAGGLGTPSSIAAAFGLGAAFVLTGSINQAAVESGLSLIGRRLLANAAIGDVTMAPAADMFELGVKVQVLKRGSMFGSRAHKLYELYNTHASLDSITGETRKRLEKEILGRSIEEIWAETSAYFQRRDPGELARAQREPKHQMALVFRWYLGLSSRWAIDGEESRRLDYQIWCGSAMSAFNDWVKGSFLEPLENRSVVQIARNLLEGAAVITRAQQYKSYGVPVPPTSFSYTPRPLE